VEEREKETLEGGERGKPVFAKMKE